jgi:RNA polymerase sigma factor (sigma-70 family)
MVTRSSTVTGGDGVDEELIQAAKAGQPHAGAFLVSLYGPRLLGYCRTIAPDLGDVDRELICEQAIEKACRKMDEYSETGSSLLAWLRGFVRYGVLSWRRDWACRDNEHVGELDPQAWEPRPQPELDPSDPRIARLAAAVKALPQHHQLLIALRFRENLPTLEIAARLHISDAAVRQRLSRLARQLRAQVEGHDDADIGGVA